LDYGKERFSGDAFPVFPQSVIFSRAQGKIFSERGCTVKTECSTSIILTILGWQKLLYGKKVSINCRVKIINLWAKQNMQYALNVKSQSSKLEQEPVMIYSWQARFVYSLEPAHRPWSHWLSVASVQSCDKWRGNQWYKTRNGRWCYLRRGYKFIIPYTSNIIFHLLQYPLLY